MIRYPTVNIEKIGISYWGMDIDAHASLSDADEVHEAITHVHELSQLPSKARQNVASLIDKIVGYAQVHGLLSSEIHTLLKCVLSTDHLDNPTSLVIINNLYPSDKIPSYVVYGLVSRLGPGVNKAALAVQAQALRWLVLVSDILEDRKSISRVYGVLFNLLDLTAHRDSVCHLLCVFTEPRHVLPHRAEVLQSLGRSPNASRHVTALLSCYHSLRPDLIPEELCAGKIASVEYPDLEWKNRLEAIQQGPILVGQTKSTESQFRVAQRSAANRRKRQHLVETDIGDGGEGLENVTGTRDFVEKLPSIVRPTDMEAVLDDPLLQHYMATGPDDVAELDEEVDLILASMFEREATAVTQGQAISARAIQTLRQILEYAQFQKFLPSSTERFIFTALAHESSEKHLPLLLELLSWRYPDSHAWKDSILTAETEKNILRRARGSPEVLLRYYILVLRNRLAMFLSGTSAFEGTPSDSPPGLTNHCSQLAMSILAKKQTMSARETVLQYIDVLAMVSSHATINNPIPIISLDAPTIYLLLFARPTISSLSALLSLLADYKKIFEEIVGANPTKTTPSKYPSDFIKRLNGYLMDCCNLFWRSRAFSIKSDDKNAAGCLLKEPTQTELARYLTVVNPDYSLSGAFSLACHPALAGPAAATWVIIEADKLGILETDLLVLRRKHQDHRANGMDVDVHRVNGNANAQAREQKSDDSVQAVHVGPVSRLSLQRLEAAGGTSVSWSQYRMAVLDWLDLRGSGGIGKLMKRTMKLLMDKPRGMSSNQLTPVASPAIVVQTDTPMTG